MNLRGVDRNKKVGPHAWRADPHGSTAGEVSHYGTCRSGSIGLILRFVPLGKSSATSSELRDQQQQRRRQKQQQQQQRHCRGRCTPCLEAELATAAPPP
ncbi:hypothetical protein PF005_g21054 [Phytophthora fragariae]|uniref:Uncharacterized protein n=1 Tax=Phytophthora fragariae TaxID=53985 RepID=A0A6A4B4R7_9STRA|nr:hypothetical protein PF005_g21054 [Phytophthora fragariae]KAE9265408.1 hypothetical protein PF001_g30902 [Phytophthora fragariae]